LFSGALVAPHDEQTDGNELTPELQHAGRRSTGWRARPRAVCGA
jgi:hypothetical protein